MYKLIAIDIDGTLINSYGEITNENKNAVKKANEAGINVILASGRNYATIQSFSNDLNLNKYAICGNGSSIYDIKNNKVIYEKTLSKEKVLDIIKICEENSIYYNIYTEKEILAKSLNYNVLYYYKENLDKEEKNKTHIKIVEDLYKYLEERNEKIIKITICDNNKSIFNSILKKLKTIDDIEVLEVSHMSRKIIRQGTEEVPIEYFYTEISAKNVDKWYAIQMLAEKLNIKKEEIVAIGDNVNDEKMIKEAGLGIAMGQSSPKITKISNYITNNNNEEGVANALKHIISN